MKPTEKTCALCSAFDAEASNCHRHPANPWPSMKPDDWCEQWTAKKDASGWRSDWPHRAALETVLQENPDGVTMETLCAKAEHPNTVTLYAAHLRIHGYVCRRSVKWFWNDEEPAQPAATTPPAPARRTYTEQEVLAQFPFGIKAAQPLPVIRRKACANLCISEAKFMDWRFNLMTAGLIQKVTMPNGEDRYFR